MGLHTIRIVKAKTQLIISPISLTTFTTMCCSKDGDARKGIGNGIRNDNKPVFETHYSSLYSE